MNMKRLYILLALVAMILAPKSIIASVYQGECGPYVTYYFDTEVGDLIIYGLGPMNFYTESDPAPWRSWVSPTDPNEMVIHRIIVRQDIDEIRSFNNLNTIESIKLPSTLLYIHDETFKDTYFYYDSSNPKSRTI